MIPPQLIVAGILVVASAATGFGAAWQIQSWRAAEGERDRAEQNLENQRLVAATRTRQDRAVIAAQDAGALRAVALRNDAAGVRRAFVGLSDAAATALRDAESSHSACLNRTHTLGELFLASTESYRSLAATSDRHASDVQTLIAAWPK